MASISLQVIQGLERGEYFSNLKVPLTIGREDDNAVQLNDERISRCHLKIQADQGRIILTDLESTNGTRVNGLPVQMTVLRPGDLVSLGRCVLLYGSHEEIQEYCNRQYIKSIESQCLDQTSNTASGFEGNESDSPNPETCDIETLGLFDEHGHPALSFPSGCPPIPHSDSLATRSEIADLINYLHSRILQVLESRGLNTSQNDAQRDESSNCASIPWQNWFKLLDLESELAKYLKEISEPE